MGSLMFSSCTDGRYFCSRSRTEVSYLRYRIRPFQYPAALTYTVEILDHSIPYKDVLITYIDDLNRIKIISKREKQYVDEIGPTWKGLDFPQRFQENFGRSQRSSGGAGTLLVA